MYMSFLEPITRENINELHVGEWIWDSKLIHRREHSKIGWYNLVEEPIGFRLIDQLELKYAIPYDTHPFRLSNLDYVREDYTWEPFEEGRYFKFKRG